MFKIFYIILNNNLQIPESCFQKLFPKDFKNGMKLAPKGKK
jgi:hypothetical protein